MVPVKAAVTGSWMAVDDTTRQIYLKILTNDFGYNTSNTD